MAKKRKCSVIGSSACARMRTNVLEMQSLKVAANHRATNFGVLYEGIRYLLPPPLCACIRTYYN